MADYCKDCSISVFGEDFRELAGLSTEADTANGLYAGALCEGCGFCQVDHDGKRVTPPQPEIPDGQTHQDTR